MAASVKAINTGYIPDRFDERDKTYYYRGSKRNPGDFQEVNLWRDHQKWLEPVYNQYSSGSCTANATAAAVRFLGRKMAQDTNREGTTIDPSRLFIYYNARAVDYMNGNGIQKWPSVEQISDEGSQIRSAMKGISKFGVAAERIWPFVAQRSTIIGVDDRPTDAAYVDAKNTYAVEYFRLDPDNNDNVINVLTSDEKQAVGRVTLARLKQCLAEGYPVVFGFNFYWKDPHWVSEDDDVPLREGDPTYASLPEIESRYRDKRAPPAFGGHAVLAVGFQNRDDMKNEGGGRVLCQNSWGPEGGHFWMSYNWILEYYATSDFWMVRLLDTPGGGQSSLVLEKDSRWTLIKDMPDNEAPVATGRAAAIALASYAAPDKSFGLWWVAADGSVQGANYIPPPTATGDGEKPEMFSSDGKECKAAPADARSSPKGTWSRYQLEDPGCASSGGAVVALATRYPEREHQRMDVFWIRADGSVRGAANVGGSFTISYEVAPAGSAFPSGPLVAIGRGDSGTDLVWLREDGSVHAAQRDDADARWECSIVCGTRVAARESGLAGASLGANHLAIFFVSPRGTVCGRTLAVRTRSRNPTPTWGDVYNVSSPCIASCASRISAVAHPADLPADESVDVFFVSRWGRLRQSVGPGDALGADMATMLADAAGAAATVSTKAAPTPKDASATPSGSAEPEEEEGEEPEEFFEMGPYGCRTVSSTMVSAASGIPAAAKRVSQDAPDTKRGETGPRLRWPYRKLDPESEEEVKALGGHVWFHARADTGLAAVSVNTGRIDVVWVGPDNALMHALGPGGDWSNAKANVISAASLTDPGALQAQAPLGLVRTEDGHMVAVFRSFDGEIVAATC